MDMAVRDRHKVLEVAKPDCVADDFGGEVVVLNLVSGVYFSLRHLAAAVWRDLVAGHSVGSLVAEIHRIDEEIAAATATFIDGFEQMGLMRQGSLRLVETSEPEAISLILAGETNLSIESFEDMQDLILSDPIHHADDQQGWPALGHNDKSSAADR
jgi:hypothetical protein